MGDYLAHVLRRPRQLCAERLFYRVIGVDDDVDQRRPVNLQSVLGVHVAVAAASLGLRHGVRWNTVVSFVTNSDDSPQLSDVDRPRLTSE